MWSAFLLLSFNTFIAFLSLWIFLSSFGLSIQSEEKVSSKEDKISNVKENEKQDIEQPIDDEEVKAEESKDISKASPEETESKKGSKTISKKTTISKVKKDPKAKNTEN